MSWLLDAADLAPFASIESAKAEAMIEDATAMAALVAPCLAAPAGSLTDAQYAAVKAIIRGAVLRWHEAGSGAMSQQTAGPFSATVDTRQDRRGMFWPSEIQQLQSICQERAKRAAFQIDTAPAVRSVRMDRYDPLLWNVL